jgi:hypothetical protein
MAATDPFLWSWEDLTRQVCHSTHLFDAAGQQPLPHTDLSNLTDDFERMQMTGQEFLTNVDEKILRSDFRACYVNVSRSLLAIIELLKSKSPLYQQHATLTRVQALTVENNHEFTSVQLHPGSAEPPVGDTRRRLNTTKIITEPLPPQSNTKQQEDRSVDTGRAQVLSGDDWSHLMRWQRDNDSIVEFDGLEDDTDEEEGDRTVEVMEEEEEATILQEPRRAGKLSSEQIIDIINERIEVYTQQWRPGKGEDAAHQPDTVKLWEDAEAEGCRQQKMEETTAAIEYYGERLDRLSEEILKAPWNTVDEVRRVCGNLEITVDLLEEAKWLLSIYALEPVSDDNDEYEINDDGPIAEHNRVLTRGSVKIIDLESGPESDPDKMDFDCEHTAVTTDTSVPPPTAAGRSSTLDSDVGDSARENAILAVRQPHDQFIQSSPSVIWHGRYPESASIHAVSQWDMNELVARADRKRIIMKVVHELSVEDRELIRERLKLVRKQDLLVEILPCVKMMSKGEARMRGVLQKDTYKIVAFTKLFLCWWLAGNYFNSKEPSEWRLEELSDTLESGCADLEYFYSWLQYILAHTFSEKALETPDAPSQAEIIVISDDED